ncbi:uncharacterized protein LOC116189569 [Punica granatum]|uniref:Uncharacterized protein LOC116189569 n=1 Tax=Punica granatum TaxID=22663 RepID=A0A6P8BXN0_PUNGR|nr:uncharacterized protein LOC116189569 [Punica granatum]
MALVSRLPPTKFFLHDNARIPIFSSSPNRTPNYFSRSKSVLNVPPTTIISCALQQGPASSASSSPGQGASEEEELRVVTAIQTSYNDIVIIETREYRALLLDSTQNVHSIFNNGPDKWTGSYWDEFAALPAIIPRDGPVAILGLGGGTAAHLMLDAWPGLDLEGWEIDEVLIHKARDYLGLSALERPAGRLEVKIGDALSPSPEASRRYAGIVVDLFGGGRVLPLLEEEETWAELKGRLMPGGRIMVNCGGIDIVRLSWAPAWELNPTIRAMRAVFGGGSVAELCWKKAEGYNYMALTGPLPDLDEWASLVPSQLRDNVRQWRCTWRWFVEISSSSTNCTWIACDGRDFSNRKKFI